MLISSSEQKVVKAIKGTARQIISLSAQAVQQKSVLGLVNLPVSHAYAWKSVKSDTGKGQEHQDRQTRLADGREAVRLGTKAQQLHIIKRFEEEIGKTPQRKKIYQEAIDRAMDEAVELKTSSTDESGSVKDGVFKVDPHNGEGSVEANEASSSSQAMEERDDDVFVREIELAKQLSMDSVYVDPHNHGGSVQVIEASSSSQALVDKDDDVFARETELAKQLSLDSAYI